MGFGTAPCAGYGGIGRQAVKGLAVFHIADHVTHPIAFHDRCLLSGKQIFSFLFLLYHPHTNKVTH
jgi:hypothetical protein